MHPCPSHWRRRNPRDSPTLVKALHFLTFSLFQSPAPPMLGPFSVRNSLSGRKGTMLGSLSGALPTPLPPGLRCTQTVARDSNKARASSGTSLSIPRLAYRRRLHRRTCSGWSTASGSLVRPCNMLNCNHHCYWYYVHLWTRPSPEGWGAMSAESHVKFYRFTGLC